jgi:hypothetical protein
VFHQKVSNTERVLITVLYQRKLCNQDVLADLLDVSRATIGNVVRETRPLLQRLGHTPTPAATRYRNTDALRAALTTNHHDTPTP